MQCVHRARRFHGSFRATRLNGGEQPRQHFQKIAGTHRERPVLRKPAGQFLPEPGNHVRHDRAGTQVARIAERRTFADGARVNQRDFESRSLQPCRGADSDDTGADDCDLRTAHSTLILRSRTTLPHLFVSLLTNCATSADDFCASGSKPRLIIFWCRSLFATASRTAALSFATTSGGVPAGAWIDSQVATSKPGTPDSAMVGISGAPARRLPVETASAFNLPSRARLIAEPIPGIIIVMRPPITSATAGALPLYGTWIMSMPAMLRNISLARCAELPMPNDA